MNYNFKYNILIYYRPCAIFCEKNSNTLLNEYGELNHRCNRKLLQLSRFLFQTVLTTKVKLLYLTFKLSILY